jgi:hypothetical protein
MMAGVPEAFAPDARPRYLRNMINSAQTLNVLNKK